MRKRGKKANPRDTKPGLQSPIKGIVKARKCRHCGHHEIGIVTKTGEYCALKPGMKIAVFPEDEGDDDRLLEKKWGGGSKS